MANITTSVSNLVGGVSQQSPKVRFVGQCEEQVNALSSVSDGLKKRQCTRVIRGVDGMSFKSTDLVHFVNRSETERYAVVLNSEVARAFNLVTGVEAAINGVTGGFPLPSYLVTSDSRKLIKPLTLADSSFFLNTTVSPAMTEDKTDAISDSEALVFIKQGDYQKNYQLNFNGQDSRRAKITPVWGAASLSRYALIGFTIQDAGSGYNSAFPPTITLTKVGTVSTAVKYVVNINNTTGEIVSITITTVGKYEKKGTATMSYPQSTASSAVINYVSGASTTAANADTTTIATGLDALITAGTATAPAVSTPVVHQNYDHTVLGNTIKFTHKLGETFYLASTDGLADAAIGVVFKTVDDLSDLPVTSFNNFRVAVRGALDSKEDDYFVKFKTNDEGSFGAGGWIEDVGAEISYKIDPETMPQRLVNTGLNAFEFNEVAWNDRVVGNDDSNPLPSFIGKPLNNLFFFKNRLGFLTDDTVIFSEAGQFFNFFRTTVRTLLDSDLIDVSAASTKISKLFSAVGFQENLILFADRGQFVVKSGDTLTSKNISITAVTNYDVDTSAEPTELGAYVYFSFTRGKYLGIREFRLDASSMTYDSADITSQIPSYIEAGSSVKIAASSTESLIAVLSRTSTTNTLYIYKYYWSGNEKVISSWSKFTMSMDIHGIEFMNSTLYILGNKENKAMLTYINMEEQRTEQDTLGNFSYHLDLLEKVTSGPTDYIDLSYDVSAGDVIEAYDEKGISVKVSHTIGNTVYLERPATCFIGIRYVMEYTFSEPVFKQQGGPQGTPSGLTRYILRNGVVFFSNAAHFRIEVTPVARDTMTVDFTPSIVDVSRASTMIFKDGAMRFSIFTEAKDSVIKIINDSAFSANFQSAEFEANAHTRSSRYA
jgi:hypothetical protein